MAKGLYRFYWDCGRQGSIESVFIADEQVVEALYDTEVYFGEALGKHSEIFGKVERSDITLISSDQDLIETLEKLNIFPTGRNPLDYPMAY